MPSINFCLIDPVQLHLLNLNLDYPPGHTATGNTGDTGDSLDELQALRMERDILARKVEELENQAKHMEKSVNKMLDKQNEIIELHKDITEKSSILGGVLSLKERKEITLEVKTVKKLLNVGIRQKGKDLTNILDPPLFLRLVSDVKKDCPTFQTFLNNLFCHQIPAGTVKKR